MHIYYQTIIYETRHKTTTTTIHHHKTRSRYIQASGLDLYDILRRPTSPTTYLPEPNSICYLPRDITASKREPGLSRDRNHWNIFAKPEIYKNLPLIPINFFFFFQPSIHLRIRLFEFGILEFDHPARPSKSAASAFPLYTSVPHGILPAHCALQDLLADRKGYRAWLFPPIHI